MVSTLNNAFAACTPPMSLAFVDLAVRSRGEMHLLFFFFFSKIANKKCKERFSMYSLFASIHI